MDVFMKPLSVICTKYVATYNWNKAKNNNNHYFDKVLNMRYNYLKGSGTHKIEKIGN